MFPAVSAFEADGSEDPKDYLHHTQNTHASKQAKCSTYTYKPFLDLCIENSPHLPNPDILSKKLSLLEVTVTETSLVAN